MIPDGMPQAPSALAHPNPKTWHGGTCGAEFLSRLSPLWESALAFRDHLRGNPESAAAYDELRVNCMKTDPGDLPAYEKAKRDFEANAIA